jgi:hypothetical protein
MKLSRTLFALAWADLLERVRRYSFLITLALAVYCGYLCSIGRISLTVNHMRGVDNSAWVGTLLALVGSTFLTLAGFYFVKNTVQHDQETGVGQILAATPISKFSYILGKFVSNLAVLSLMILVLAFSAVVIQLLGGEDNHIRIWTLLSPFLFLTVPAIALVAALAVLFETIPYLRSGFGNVVYFFLWIAMLSIPAATGHQTIDLGGISIVEQSTSAAAHVPDGKSSFTFAAGRIEKPAGTFRWDGIVWSEEILLTRLALLGLTFLLVLLASLSFNRFDSSPAYCRATPASPSRPCASPAADTNFPITPVQVTFSPLRSASSQGRFGTMLSAELKLMLKGQKWWWYVTAAGFFLASACIPNAKGRGIALSCAWIWPVLLWSSMGIRERRYRTDQILFSVSHPIRRQLPAVWLSGVLLALLTGSGFALRLLPGRNLAGLLAWGIATLFIPSFALALGVWSGTGKPFEILYTLLWYVGPMHALPAFDFMSSAPATAATRYPFLYLALSAVFFVLALAGRKRQLLA